MTEYSKFPQYQSVINNAYACTESQILSELNDYQNPTLTSTEIQFNENDMVVKPAIYSEPKYIKKKEVHETLKPISNEVKFLPTKTKQKVKTLDTFYNKTIILSENDDVNQILQNNQMFEQQINPPLPTQSTIANLCKDSVLISSSSSSNYNPSQQQTNNFQTQSDYNNLINEQQMYDTKVIAKVLNDNQKSYNNQPLASKVSKISNISKNQSKVNNSRQNSNTQNLKYQSTNINNNYNISKVSNFPSTYTNFGKEYSGTKVTKISGNRGNLNINNFNQNQMPLNVPNINKDYHQSKIQMSKISYMKSQSKLNNLNNDGAFEEVTDLSKKSNKNFVQEYFHDDDIPEPIVYEGSGLDNSEIKPNINNNFDPSNQEQKIIEQSIKNSKNGQSSIQKNSYVNQTNIINNNINNKSMSENNTNNNYNKSLEQNNINNKSIQKFSSKEAQQTNSLLAQIPVDQSEIMSHQPSINMSQKESIIFKKSVHQSTVDPNLIQDSKIQRQSKAYQQKSNIPSNLQKSNANQSSYNSKNGNSSQAYAQTQKSNMTYQQPYNQYNQSQNNQNPQIYYSQDIQNYQYNNNQKSIKEPSNMKVSGQQSKINKIDASVPISQNINNQSNIYQNSVKNSGVNNIGNDNIIISNQIIQSNNSKNNQYVISQHQSKIGQSNDLIASSNGTKKRESDIFEPTPNKSNTSKNNNSYNKVKGDRSSFPTQSYAGNFNSKEAIPPNPFGEQSNSIKGSNLKMLEDKLKDSEIK